MTPEQANEHDAAMEALVLAFTTETRSRRRQIPAELLEDVLEGDDYPPPAA